MRVVGLTGGIASGKSTVSNLLRSQNIPVIDADKIAREIVMPGSRVLEKISEVFGNNILMDDGSLNRKMLGDIVFSDNERLQILNNLTHPAIKNIIKDRIDSYKKENKKLCIIDAAILIEGNFTDLVDCIILIYADVKEQINRLMHRDNITEGEAVKRIDSQMAFEDKKKYANYILDNSKDLEYTKKQLWKILNELMLVEDIDG